MVSIKVGTTAPDFALFNQDGKEVKLSSLRGKKVVLFFYPKDFSPGCTREACHFRDNYEDFTDTGAVVIGISNDDIESHKKFIEENMLPFTLLSDRGSKVSKLYGVSGGLLPGRVTFVIDSSGIVKHVFSSAINMKAHIEESLKVIKQMK